jgi:hypothetical protein
MKLTLINDNRFHIDFDYSLQGKTKSFKEELQDHLLEIAQNHKKIYLLFSGGMDSRFLALNLLELGIDFTAVTYGFKEDFTDYDSRVSTEFVKEHGFKQELFYITEKEFIEAVKSLDEKGLFTDIRNQYYLISAIRRYDEPNCAFITGAASEFKIKNKKVDFPFNIYTTQTAYPNLFNFTTDKIVFAYFDEPIIKENYKTTEDQYDLRNKLYNNIFPDKLKIIEKTFPEDKHFDEAFSKILNLFFIRYPFVYLTNRYILDLDEYYQEYEERKKNGS